MTEPKSTNTRNGYMLFILKVGALSAVLATVVSALAVAVLNSLWNRWLPNPLDFMETVLLLCPITAVSCGSFGFLAGFAGGTAIYSRRSRIRSKRRLLIEASLAGLLFGCLFPFFDAAMNSLFVKSFQLFVIPRQIFLYPLLSIPCALICALVFRKHFLEDSTPASKAS